MTATEVCRAFWLTWYVDGKPREFWGKTQNDLPVELRAAFVDYVDGLHRSGEISDRVARSITLR